jgi:RraA family protein
MIGFRILGRARRVGAGMAEAYRELPVANISDAMFRMAAGGARLRPMHDGTPMSGPAFTVKSRPGDNLMLHKALDLAEPGDVIVVDAGGDLTNAIMGEIMAGYAQSRGIAGVVINGAIRDAGALRKSSFPVFAAGVTHRGPYKDGPGEINVPVAIDGMVIEPGDLVVGDDDGVLCVSYDAVEEIYEATTRRHQNELKEIEAIAKGTFDRSWVDKRLRQLGLDV